MRLLKKKNRKQTILLFGCNEGDNYRLKKLVEYIEGKENGRVHALLTNHFFGLNKIVDKELGG